MSLDLHVLPLTSVENLISQKCLLTKKQFPQIGRPGQWAKCCFRNAVGRMEANFAVCQIYPRDGDENVCYLDTSVCKCETEGNEEDIVLDSVELLDDIETELTDIQVSFSLDPKYYIQNIETLSRTFLKNIAQILLQGYHFSTTCTVSSAELKIKGVDAIYINLAGFKANSNFIITEYTTVYTENVLLTNDHKDKIYSTFDVPAFKMARQQLDDLMEAAKMQRYCSSSRQRPSLNALLVGAVGCGKTTLVREFLKDHRCNVFEVSISNVVKQYPGETEAELRKIFKAAIYFEMHFKSKEPTVILLEDVHLLCPQIKSTASNSEALTNSLRIASQLSSLIDELFNRKINIICLATTTNPDMLNDLTRRPGRFEKEIHISLLTYDDRKIILEQLFSEALPNRTVSMSLFQLVAKQTPGYVLADLALLVYSAVQLALTKPLKCLEDILKESLRKSQPMSLRGTDVTAYRTNDSFAAIGGMLELKKVLEVSILAAIKKENAFRTFGLTLPKGVLLYGPPGCAKTTIAKCLATEAKMTFIATSGAEVYSPYIGCAEKFIAKIFDTARKNSPCVIFLDEIDTLVGRRSVNASSADVQMRILSTLLTEMDGIIAPTTTNGLRENAHIIVVAATNRPDMVDDALLRPGRFDKLIHVPAPDLASRRSILALYKQKMPFAKDVDIDKIAARTENYSGADLCNLCNEVAINAFQRDINTNQILYKDFEYVLKTCSKSSLTQKQIDWYYQFESSYVR